MRKRFASLFAVAFMTAVVACTTLQTEEAAPAKGDCFNASQVSGFSEREGASVRVQAGASPAYDLELAGPSCDDVAWAQVIAIDPSPSPWLCVGERPSQGRVFFRDSASSRVVRCQITEVLRAAETLPQ